MNRKYKLVVTDMDGTLLNDDKRISEENVRIIREVTSKGIKVAFVSGREYKFLKNIADEYEIDIDVIGLNGTEIRNEKGEIIWKRSLGEEEVETIINLLNEENALYKVFGDGEVLGNKPKDMDSKVYNILKIRYKSEEITDELIKKEKERFFSRGILIDDVYKYIKNSNYSVAKIEVIDANRNFLNSIQEKIGNLSEVFITSSYYGNIEIMHKEVNKGNAIKNFAKCLGITVEEIIAFGDNVNDIEMLETAGLGVAMENAKDEVKAKADYITLNNNEDGVAYAIRKFVL